MDNMSEEHWRELHPIIVECCTGLFQANGVAVTWLGEAEEALVSERGMASYIGFAGQHLRGNLVISMPFELVQRAHPIDPATSPDAVGDLLDWTAELANQLLGRVKNRLLARGAVLSLSTPVSFTGRELRGSLSPDGTRLLRFSGGDADIYVQIDARLQPGFTLTDEPPAGPEAPALEGDFMLF